MRNRAELLDVIQERLAAQWIAYGGQLEGHDERTAIDPDALVTMTAGLGDPDSRVVGVAIDWCVQFGTTINTSRLRRVAREIGVEDEALGRFAGAVSSAGGPRWPFAEPGVPAQSRGKVVARDVLATSRLAWRIRSAFGVTTRADVLTVLLSIPPNPVSIADLARRARHSKRNTANAITSMSMAGVVDTSRQGNRDRVWLDRRSPLRKMFEPDGVADVDWVSRWRVLWRAAHVDVETRDFRSSARLVETRSVVNEVLVDLESADLPRPDMSATGRWWGAAFDAWLDDLTAALHVYSA